VIGEEAAGTWLLQVADHARYDTGTLNSWSLRLVLGEEQVIRVRTDESRTIPDSDPAGIASSLTVERDGPLRAISVTVDITHTWVGDLQVTLATPTGQEVVLHGRSGGSADNLMATYTHRDLPALEGLVRAGGNVRGRWTLRVADLAQADVGKLNGWGLDLTVGGPV
jgi:subtilisin-like proprotein convertase family protein